MDGRTNLYNVPFRQHKNAIPTVHLHKVTYFPRLCHIQKPPGFTSFGFDLQAGIDNKGCYIGKVEVGYPAHDAGLLEGDRVLEVNGTNVVGETIQKVAQRILSKGTQTTLLVVDKVTDQLYKDQSTPITSSMAGVKQLAATKLWTSKLPTNMDSYQPHGNKSYQANSPGVVVNQPSVKYDVLPVQTRCPYCHNMITSKVSFEPGRRTWLAILFLALIGCELGCFLIPLCLNECKDAHHICPKCGLELGCYKR